MNNNGAEAKRWFDQGVRDRAAAESNRVNGFHEVACFLCQQSAEKLLKAFLYRQGERMVVYKHALRNMMVPLLTIVGLFIAIALTGTVLTETVFTRPGLGKMLVDAIGARDYPLAQGAITVFTMIIIAVNLVVDMLCAVVDPRVTYR